MATFGDVAFASYKKEDLDTISNALKNDTFVKEFGKFVENICDPKNMEHYQEECKMYHAERGVDVKFLHPGPGCVYAIECSKTEQLCLVNICVDSSIVKPLLAPAKNKLDVKGVNCKIPHTFSAPRSVPISAIDSSIREKLSIPANEYSVYDVIVHPSCVEFLQQHQPLIHKFVAIITDSLQQHFQLHFHWKNSCWIEFKKSAGKPSIYQLKTITDKEKLNKAQEEDSKLCGIAVSKKQQVKPSEKDIQPEYSIKYIDHISWQDYSMLEKKNSPFDSIALDIKLPGICKASLIDVEVEDKSFSLKTVGDEYKLDLVLSYPVHKNPTQAKFDVTLQKLYLELPIKKTPKVFHSFSTDSGIESDFSSSYESSTSMNEISPNLSNESSSDTSDSPSVGEIDCINPTFSEESDASDLSSEMAEKSDSPPGKKYFDAESLETPDYTLSQSANSIEFDINSEHYSLESITMKIIDESIVKFFYSNTDGGKLPIEYGLVVDISPVAVKQDGITFSSTKTKLHFSIKKASNTNLKTIKIGPKIGNLEQIPMPRQAIGPGSKKGRGSKSKGRSGAQSKKHSSKKVGPKSESVAGNKDKYGNPRTCSHPKGILKFDRSRCDSSPFPLNREQHSVRFGEDVHSRVLDPQFEKKVEKSLDMQTLKLQQAIKEKAQSESIEAEQAAAQSKDVSADFLLSIIPQFSKKD